MIQCNYIVLLLYKLIANGNLYILIKSQDPQMEQNYYKPAHVLNVTKAVDRLGEGGGALQHLLRLAIYVSYSILYALTLMQVWYYIYYRFIVSSKFKIE